MTDTTMCQSMQEQMPEVIRGRMPWRVAELEHLSVCADCQLEWQLIEAGAALHQDLQVDTVAISERLRARLAAEPVEASIVRPLRTRRLPAGLGLLAAAASIALIFGLRTTRVPVLPPSAPTEAAKLLPELDNLSEAQLETVLSEVELSDDGSAPMRLPRLGDLTENQLEHLLNELEG